MTTIANARVVVMPGRTGTCQTVPGRAGVLLVSNQRGGHPPLLVILPCSAAGSMASAGGRCALVIMVNLVRCCAYVMAYPRAGGVWAGVW